MELYFPEDKMEYIPSVILLLIFVVITIFAMKLIKKLSDKELEKTKHLEEQIMQQTQNKVEPKQEDMN